MKLKRASLITVRFGVTGFIYKNADYYNVSAFHDCTSCLD